MGERALYLNNNSKKFVKSLLVLFLTEMLGPEGCSKIKIEINKRTGVECDFILTLYKEPGSLVNYTLESGVMKYPEGTVIEDIFICRNR
jgi:hypothetical protein